MMLDDVVIPEFSVFLEHVHDLELLLVDLVWVVFDLFHTLITIIQI